ncbi:isochorismate synthase [Cumulibacter soli]|uniref:isochorismate synthase n=1 Tax=Cumulibacter soli TaxID=2546344 RepID=UPI001068517D|nr:isochorismate synthase [Cumulibacter soli]
MTTAIPTQMSTGAATATFLGDCGRVSADITHTWVTESSDQDWADVVTSALGPEERAIASLAFRSQGAAVAHRLAAHASAPIGRHPKKGERQHTVVDVIDEGRYAEMVAEAVRQIRSGDLEKVVLGRTVDVISEPPLRAEALVGQLQDTRPGKYIFSVPLAEGPNAPTILGASPELLVRRRGLDIASVPLAGSIPRSADPRVDRERAEALAASSKDQAEHAFVVDGIREVLEPLCERYYAASSPELLSTDTMWHLATPIRARLRDDDSPFSALHLAQMLQPTAAVGGYPAALAERVIDELEGDVRGHLAGAVGWVDGGGNGEFALTIRSGVLHGNRFRLFAGAGIVDGSDPASETTEVASKLRTMMKAVGL